MRLERIAWSGPADPAASDLRARLEREGYSVWRWHDAPGASYAAHSHDHDESLWVIEGEITFGASDRDLRLSRGDRLMLPRETVHTAKVGPHGATYLIG